MFSSPRNAKAFVRFVTGATLAGFAAVGLISPATADAATVRTSASTTASTTVSANVSATLSSDRSSTTVRATANAAPRSTGPVVVDVWPDANTHIRIISPDFWSWDPPGG